MLERILIAIESVVLALWAGAMAGFAFVFAPIAIKIVPDISLFARLVSATIGGVANLGNLCGGVAIVAALSRAAFGSRAAALARVGLTLVALAATAYETRAVIPSMEATAAQIPGPIDSVPKDDPRRAAYDREHETSTRVYGVAFLCVLTAVVLAPFGRKAG